MICISINQESRRLVLADMLNAGRYADLLEVRLDRFGKAPDLGEILALKSKPLIITCRRAADGGFWDGSEEERQALLRQCIISKADYVEIELDIADDIRRYGPTKRVIAYTNLKETPNDIQELYDEARNKTPDVIKLVTLARTPEEAWPLVQIAAKATVPTVIVGLGKANTMLALLGKKIGAPWIYAALERGMEAYPGQPTIDDLKNIFHLDSIQKNTRFVGVLGQGPRELVIISCLNSAFAAADLNLRCLPLEMGNPRIFRKLIDIVKLAAVVVDQPNVPSILELEPELHGTARKMKALDLLVPKDNVLHGFHKGSKAWMEALSNILKTKFDSNQPFKDRMVVIVGLGPAARLLAGEIQAAGGSAILASFNKRAGVQLAQEIGCRFVLFEAIYSTMHDVLIVCDEEKDPMRNTTIHAGYLKPGMVVMDLTSTTVASPFLQEAAKRTESVVAPLDLFLEQMAELARMLTSKPIQHRVLLKAIPQRFLEEES